ncbi:hypothetical protein AB835_00570 [Candidatus Endobugula sertula]|uniref:Uncharacterized protein n=1 Tax=Candidatus Endobugula sertula TaxID=62101 RepID=A0A1D2QU10_9GAMM|nr:hypothetical protein AB835_00570 [Candidatus Endobugula sertula]
MNLLTAIKFSTQRYTLNTAFVIALGLSSTVDAQQRVSYTYNNHGQILTIDGPRTDVSDITTYTYNMDGYRDSMTNAVDHQILLSDFNKRGQPQLITDANGIETRLTYHVRGWLLSSTVLDPTVSDINSPLNSVTTYSYDNVGQLTRITFPNHVQLNYHYDTSQRLIGIRNNRGEKIDYTLDNAGNRIAETIKDGSHTLKYTMTQAYDELSRLMETVGAEGQTTHWDYDVNNNPTQSTNPRHFATQHRYDSLDRLSQTTDANGGTTQLGYDTQNRLTSVTDANGHTTTYEYDAFDNVVKQTSPDTGITTYTYDNANNRTSMTDARGIVTRYSYDAINRLIQVDYDNYPEETVVYTYDATTAASSDQKIYGVGRLTHVRNGDSTIHYQYDYRGNLTQQSNEIDHITYMTHYQYDAANNLTQMTYPNGVIITYDYDDLGRVHAIHSQAPHETQHTLVNNIRYLPFDGINAFTYGNGITTTISHDQDYRLTHIAAIGDQPILNLSYGYDLNSNIQQQDNLTQVTHNQLFGYDPLDRLEQADGDYGQQQFSYDPVGNRTQVQFSKDNNSITEDYHYSTTSNQLQDVDTTPTIQPIIADDQDPSSHTDGDWRTSSMRPPYAGHSQYSWDGSVFTWELDVPNYGEYEVQAWWTAYSGRTNAAEYRFTSTAGEQRILKSQRIDGGQWNSLGTHFLEKGTLWIHVQNKGIGDTNADAIRLVLAKNLQAIDSQTLILNSNGNTIESLVDGKTLTTDYNAANRPSTVSITDYHGTLTANYRYNALGQRIQKTLTPPAGNPPLSTTATPEDTTHYIYNLQGQLISEIRPNHHTQKHIIYLNDQPIATQTTDQRTHGTPIILDDQDFTGTQAPGSGPWKISGMPNPYEGQSQYSWGQSSFTWSVNLPTTQTYDIQAWWTSHAHRIASADYQFMAQDGEQIVQVDQRILGGQWNSLGVYTLNTGNVDITLKNTTYGVLSADAIKLIPLNTTTQTHYIHNDHLGTPQILTNENQNTVWEAQYDPFGKATITTELVENNLRFPGQVFDKESGLHYNWNRYYDPLTDRFTQSDPTGLFDGTNTYIYAQANPLKYVDLNGLWSVSFDAYAGIGGGITLSRNEKTGRYFAGGRLGIGIGGGANINLLDNGPEERARRTNPYAEDCPNLQAGSSGTAVGGFANASASYNSYGIGYGASGGRFFDGTGDSYSSDPQSTGLGFNPAAGKNLGISFGASAGIESIGWW